MNKKYYMILNTLIVNAAIFAQQPDFPSEPNQARWRLSTTAAEDQLT